MDDRERLIELLLDFEGEFNSFVFDRERLTDHLIDNGVTVQKHGRWKGAGMGDYRCSICCEEVSGNRHKYCPNCGAKMDLEES